MPKLLMSMPSNLLALVCAGAILAGCGNMQSARDSIDRDLSDASRGVAQMESRRKTGAVTRHQGAKLTAEEVVIRDAKVLPQIFSQPFVYLTVPQSLSDILSEIGRRTGMIVNVQAGAIRSSQMATASVGAGAMPQDTGLIALDWKSDLKSLLDHLSSRNGLFWKFENGRINIFQNETRTFHIHLPTGKRTVSSSISLSGAGGASGGSSGSAAGGSTGASSSGSTGGGGASTVSVTNTMEVDAYEAIRQSVQSIVSNTAIDGSSPSMGGTGAGTGSATSASGATTTGSSSTSSSGGSVMVNSTLGVVTVTANPITMERVEQYINSINERYAQNVMIAVKVYNVTLKREINAGVSINLLYENLVKKYGLNITGTPNLSATSGTPGTLQLDALPGSKFSGSSLLLQALDQIGDVSLRTSGQVIAANGQATPLQVANDVTYLASSTTTAVQGAGITTSLVPATRTVGFTANFLPLILGDNRILLQYQINLSSLLGLNQVVSNGSMIQTPEVATQALQQQAYLRDGQTLALFGFEQERSSAQTATGVTGVSRNADQSRNMMVIVMEVFSGQK